MTSSKTTSMTDKYIGVKNTLQAELGEAYPKNMNGLTDEFIVKKFIPKLEKSDIIKIAKKRDEMRNGENANTKNWYPAFRSWVGKTYFSEFGAKKNSKKKNDENGDFLKDLLASLGD